MAALFHPKCFVSFPRRYRAWSEYHFKKLLQFRIRGFPHCAATTLYGEGDVWPKDGFLHLKTMWWPRHDILQERPTNFWPGSILQLRCLQFNWTLMHNTFFCRVWSFQSVITGCFCTQWVQASTVILTTCNFDRCYGSTRLTLTAQTGPISLSTGSVTAPQPISASVSRVIQPSWEQATPPTPGSHRWGTPTFARKSSSETWGREPSAQICQQHGKIEYSRRSVTSPMTNVEKHFCSSSGSRKWLRVPEQKCFSTLFLPRAIIFKFPVRPH